MRRSSGAKTPERRGKPSFPEHCLVTLGRRPPPVRVEPVAIHSPREPPRLFERHDLTSLHATILTPPVDAFLRPEEQDRRSGVAYVVPPARGGHCEVDDGFHIRGPASLDLQGDLLPTIGAA